MDNRKAHAFGAPVEVACPAFSGLGANDPHVAYPVGPDGNLPGWYGGNVDARAVSGNPGGQGFQGCWPAGYYVCRRGQDWESSGHSPFASGWSEATQGFYRTGTLHVILNLVLDVTVSSRGAFSDPYHSGYITMSR